MSIDAVVSGGGAFDGAASSIFSYSVVEESTPVVLSDTSGGTGQVTFDAVDEPSRLGSQLLLGSTVNLTDDKRGTATGTITNMSGGEGLVSVSADSPLARLVARRDANSVNGTFAQAITYYFSLVGITSGFTVDASLASKTVVAPGWFGEDVWTHVKELCVLMGADIAPVGNSISIRPVRQVTVTPLLNSTSFTWDIAVGDLQQSVTVNYYTNEARTNFLVIPEGGWTPEARVLQVDVDETVVENLPVNMWVSSVEQPTPQNQVDRYYTASSTYSIIGNDGFPIPAQQWLDHGGKVTYAIGENKTSIDVTMKGPRKSSATAKYAPYRLAVSDGSNYYSTLRIRATGIYYIEQSVTVPTGLESNRGTEDGITVTVPFVRTQADAFGVAMNVANSVSTPLRTVTFSTDKFKTSNSVPQTLGYVAGSRVQYRRAIYRVRSATITETGVEYTAESDTTYADVKASATGMTFAQLKTLNAGLTYEEISQIPLPVVKPEYDKN